MRLPESNEFIKAQKLALHMVKKFLGGKPRFAGFSSQDSDLAQFTPTAYSCFCLNGLRFFRARSLAFSRSYSSSFNFFMMRVK